MYYGICPICHKDGGRSHYLAWQGKLAIYVRRPKKGFVRVGTLYTRCRHAVYSFTGTDLDT